MAGAKSTLLSGWRVIVADDEQFIRAIVLRMVRDLGCQDALTASTGQEAIGHLQSMDSDKTLLMSDFNMPGIDGLTMVKLIRTGKAGCPHNIPIIMLTGHADSGLVSTALALDVDSFLIKPISTDQLATRFLRVLDGTNTIAPARDYEQIDVDEVRKRMIRNAPVGTPRPSNAAKLGPKVMNVRLQEVQVGQILAEDIKTPSGERLLGAGVVLNERYLRRLNELSDVIRLEYVPIIVAPK